MWGGGGNMLAALLFEYTLVKHFHFRFHYDMILISEQQIQCTLHANVHSSICSTCKRYPDVCQEVKKKTSTCTVTVES